MESHYPSFETASTHDSGSWSVDLSLSPGTGALLQTPTLFTNTFVGTVLDRNGGGFEEGDILVPQTPFSGPNGVYLMADPIPVSNSVSNFFYYMMGRDPNEGEQVITLNGTSTYSSSSGWSSPLQMNVGKSALINAGPSGSFEYLDPITLTLVPVPEPSVAALTVLGLALLHAHQRRRA